MAVPKTLKGALAAALALAMFATGVVVGRVTSTDVSAEARACRVFDLASSRLEAAAVTPFRRGLFTPDVVDSWRQQTARIDSVVSTGDLEEPVFSALRDVGDAYAVTSATATDYMDAETWNSNRVKNVLADNAEAESRAVEICGQVTA